MTQKSIGPWPPTPLDLRAVQANQLDAADIPRDLSSGNFSIAGHLVGGDLVGDPLDLTPNPAPIMPGAGTRGHDHSGGAAGRPFGRSIWWLNADWDWDGSAFTPNARTHFVQVNQVFDSNEEADFSFQTHPVPVPGCDPGPQGAYVLLGGMFRVIVYAPTVGFAVGDAFMRVSNRHPDINTSYDFPFFASVPGEQNFNSNGVTFPRIQAIPGEVNPITLGFYVKQTLAGPTTKTVGLEIKEAELGVYEVPS